MKLTHADEQGRVRMVDISGKPVVRRTAWAEGRLFISPETRQIVVSSLLPKGDPFEVARLAGIQAAKQASQWIPLCHTLNLDHADVQIDLEEGSFRIRSQVTCRWATGVEMEALAAVTAAALTLYDMCKAVDRNMVIGEIRLVGKEKEEPGDPQQAGRETP